MFKIPTVKRETRIRCGIPAAWMEKIPAHVLRDYIVGVEINEIKSDEADCNEYTITLVFSRGDKVIVTMSGWITKIEATEPLDRDAPDEW